MAGAVLGQKTLAGGSGGAQVAGDVDSPAAAFIWSSVLIVCSWARGNRHPQSLVTRWHLGERLAKRERGKAGPQSCVSRETQLGFRALLDKIGLATRQAQEAQRMMRRRLFTRRPDLATCDA